jgi:hypothetical protein
MTEQRDSRRGTPDRAPARDASTSGRCAACRGTGVVISNLGGEAHEVECPWCEGDGVRLRGHDAQARWRERSGEA